LLQVTFIGLRNPSASAYSNQTAVIGYSSRQKLYEYAHCTGEAVMNECE